ncbi:hypothetical protein NSK_007385 [Nannochloropsis salina CCMP1776]|uniref:GIY-YIG domain-containing protein n=1 Tax=Nannochloropsis salina CCMP1776 TaxID=1027361 RepID=A0A4D9CSA1_9STRA|nr:hypothetical protein NSK_007385 [Nannochloropsis salina CCMP1776]|eukprot:TFJ81424.1 hypothetical protein NSK_007385 [Nannochloropsis salina CCMP1776]
MPRILSVAFVCCCYHASTSAFFLQPTLSTKLVSITSVRQTAALEAGTSASLDDQADFVKAELARKKQEYDASLKARISASVANADVADSIPPLDSLPYVPYLDETGKINDCGADAKVKASVYALYDESETVRYIGVSRSVAQSLRLHLARMPEQTYGFRVYHISKPTRVLLEITRDTWVDQLGYQPQGNDNGPNQQLWESALDVKPLMNEADHAALETARIKQRSEENAMKKVTRRFEEAKISVLNARGVTESLRFDPKLKGKGLLDLYLEKQPDSAVPDSKPSSKKTS